MLIKRNASYFDTSSAAIGSSAQAPYRLNKRKIFSQTSNILVAKERPEFVKHVDSASDDRFCSALKYHTDSTYPGSARPFDDCEHRYTST